MSRIIAILLISTSLNAQGFKPTDTQLHICATYIISSFATSYAFEITKDKKKAMWIGFGIGMTVGIAKEIYDVRHGGGQTSDIIGDFIGSSLGCLVVTIPLP